jgi:hypothetical protein
VVTSADYDVVFLGHEKGESLVVTSRLNSNFEIDPFLIGTNFAVKIQRILWLQSLPDSIVDQFCDLCQEGKELEKILKFLTTIYKWIGR